MEYREKEIVDLRKATLIKKKQSIYDDYLYIGNERLEFCEQVIISPQVKMMFPKTFADLPQPLAKRMYPSEFRPEIIKTNPSLTLNFAFTLFKNRIEMDEVATCARFYLDTMKRVYPGNQYLENSECFMDEEQTRVLGWYTFSNPALEGWIYNLHAFMQIEGRLLFSLFHANESNRFEAWKPFVFQMLSSVTSARGKEEMGCEQNRFK